MSTDGHAEDKPPLLAEPMAWLTRRILQYPRFTLALAVLTAAAATVYSMAYLGYRTSRMDLLNPKSTYNRLWLDYIKEFGDEDDAVVVVEGPGREALVPVLEELSTLLAREDRLFHAVFHGVDLRKVRAKGLHYLSVADLAAIERFLDEAQPIVTGNWARLNLGQMAGGLYELWRLEAQATGRADAAEAQLARLTAALGAGLGPQRGYRSPWPEMPAGFATLSELNSQYLLTQQGQLGFVLLRLAVGDDGFNRGGAAIDELRRVLDQVRARHPEVTIGLTGLPVMENDEMLSSQSSMVWASALSFVGVGLLFIAGFGGLRHALLANSLLIVGMAWSFAYVTATVGHLNILSVSFTTTLIGIGIDFGIYYVARYLNLRTDGHDCEPALIETSRTAGPAIVTGAVSTAVAFFSAGFTSFTGVAELGIVAGGGLLLCAAAELLVLPATIALVDRSGLGVRMPAPLPIQRFVAPFARFPRGTLVGTAALTLLVAAGLGRLWYDNNLLNMQAQGIESVELEKKLLSQYNQSVWYALSIADTGEDLLARKAQFEKLPSVERTEEIVSLLPSDETHKQPIIERISRRLAELPERPPLLTVEKPERLGQCLARLEDLAARSGRDERLARQLAQVRDQLRRLSTADCYAAVSQFQQNAAGDLLSRLHLLRSIANPEPPQLADLPASLVDRFVGHHGRHLLKIYGKGNIWDHEALARFVADVRSVDPRATGNPLQAHEASHEMRRSYQEAAAYSLLVIVAVLLLEFRNWRHAVLAILPLGLGMVQTFGLLGILDMPLNPANLIALPLMLGIGVDYGVHIVHEYREQGGRYSMTCGTAVAVLIDALTTIVGYGSMMIASHQGLQSLGRVLTIGITFCLINSLVFLPALLALTSRRRGPMEAVAEPAAQLVEPQRAAAVPQARPRAAA